MDAGYKAEGAVIFQERLLVMYGERLLPFMSTHPAGQQRIDDLHALIREIAEAKSD
jgi:predicted Zn-dependent protease